MNGVFCKCRSIQNIEKNAAYSFVCVGMKKLLDKRRAEVYLTFDVEVAISDSNTLLRRCLPVGANKPEAMR